MRLKERPDRYVDLKTVSYEHPERSGDEWDDNWLVIHGHVRADGLRWHFWDACLLVDEAEELGQWLLRAAHEDVPPLEFTEPNLALEVVDRDPAHHVVTITITFRAESFPPGVNDDVRWNLGRAVTLHLTMAVLISAGHEWLAYLERFPRR